MPQELLVEFEQEPFDQKMINKDPETALKHLIAQQSNGHHIPNIIHSIVQAVMMNEDNKLKRLLYYFFETMNKEDKSFIICLNQIKKDLSSPNEFVRGLVLKFISTLENIDYVLPLLKDIKENLNNKCAYVRMNALFCLGEIGLRFDLEVESEILNSLKNESNSQVLIVGFDKMHKLGMSFEDFLEIDYPKEILETLVDKNDDINFLKRVVNSKFNTVSFYSSCKLLSKGIDQESNINNIVRILETDEDLKQDFLPYLRFVTQQSFELLNLINPYDYEFSSNVIDNVFKHADTSDFLKIADFLYQKFTDLSANSEKKKAFKILLLQKITVFSSSHCIFIDSLVSVCLKNILTDDPELIFAALGFLEVCILKNRFNSLIHPFLIENFSKLKFGKILRKIFDILAQNLTKENFEKLLNMLLIDLGHLSPFQSTENENLNKNYEIPFYLSKQSEVYIGAHIALSIIEAYKEEWNSDQKSVLKSKTIGVLLKLIEVGELQNILDISSKSTIISCVRALLSGIKLNKPDFESICEFKNENVLKPVQFSLLTTPLAFKKFVWADPLGTDLTTIQLSGLGDPLYIEANCIHSRYEISLDILVINQTSSYLQNISMDFNFSKNIQMISPVNPFSLQPNSATTIKAQFSILESFSSFITATVTFRYQRKNDFSGRPFVQNLSEIFFEVNKFLEGADIDFKSEWKNLEWENIYSITIKKDNEGIIQKIADKINGHLCDKLESFGFVVGNIACYTIKKSLLLVNVCVSSGEASLIEIRVRSKDEDLVKSISSLLSQFLKSHQ